MAPLSTGRPLLRGSLVLLFIKALILSCVVECVQTFRASRDGAGASFLAQRERLAQTRASADSLTPELEKVIDARGGRSGDEVDMPKIKKVMAVHETMEDPNAQSSNLKNEMKKQE
eukprot:Cvel_6807.t1-p1 / transcript=Cvel_6807.t1 / gene=Cvel_6807 / organism=Chromera_velia_CCMP2878 / gene_product=hypothetical protein / transcript_product=hypothetical protein / location=Cvel_scaffold343:3831-11354(-) / protein_length=115 / sequence_SO=supercontig / SO=protein_coding / is_pseudo=false